MRDKKEIEQLIQSLEKNIEILRKSRSKYRDDSVPLDIIRENQYRIHTLEWVLGKHERFD
ncbi:hypothetical protein [Virgibacillus halodenitrificans]|uniref:hypothetical protein n=1 Tax=Virgibacillus halodenitrificans TaxID=1482 RepID=UPI000EF50EBA|nr:hypothetical protein [Virgibacillus halodenitrificans]